MLLKTSERGQEKRLMHFARSESYGSVNGDARPRLVQSAKEFVLRP